MRFLPLLSCTAVPDPWAAFPAVELALDGTPHPGWVRGPAVHALHLTARPWDEGLVAQALEGLRSGLGPDFLVIPAAFPDGLAARSAFLGTLEVLLEALQGRGVKVALRLEPEGAAALAGLLKEVRGEAVGFCWHGALGDALEALEDRLFTALGDPGDDLTPLRRLGYRWNVALPVADPAEAAALVARLGAAWPGIPAPEVTA